MQKGKSIETLRSDRGGEYMSTEFGDFQNEHGIVCQFTPPGTPQLNGVSERRNRTLLDMARLMMSYTDFPISMWGYVLQTQRVVISRDAIFLEKQFVQEGGIGRQIVLDEESSIPQTNQAPISMDTNKIAETPTQVENVTEPRRSGRVTRTPARYLNLPENLEAMKSEIDSMSEKQVWDLIDPPKGIIPIGNKWVFKRKIGADGKDLGEATYILGIRIYINRPKRLIGLSQALYLDKVLKRFNMQNSRRGLLPVRHGIHLSKGMSLKTPEDREKMAQVPYASAIGSLMYTMLCTRPDITYAISVTSRYQSNPELDHWTAVKNILKYLRRTKDMILVYGRGELRLDELIDSDFQSDVDDKKSIFGYIFTCNGGAVSRKSSKQETTADSTTKAEYIVASDAAKEAVLDSKVCDRTRCCSLHSEEIRVGFPLKIQNPSTRLIRMGSMGL
ncbi:hypothetical protein CRG98_025996 [Punica granatum]|uniref:Integrase catalytic domain-containing protein n=1 Tax=Punica granatum TaxID=22663 RepID=A0A2I0JBJ0_PUNGR|nr:hypothetical protein CRG98_025996 [Punica granatum]